MSKFLTVSAKSIENARSAEAFWLTPPDDARTDTRDERIKYWAEVVQVTGVNSELRENGNTNVRIVVQVMPEAHDGTNAGRVLSGWHELNFKALEKGDPSDGQFKMSRFSLNRLGELLELVGLWGGEGEIPGDTLATAFDDVTGESPIIGLKAWVEIKQEPDRRDDTKRRDNIRKYLPVEE